MPGSKITADLLLRVDSRGLAGNIEDALLSGVDAAVKDARKKLSSAFKQATIDGIVSGQGGNAIKKLFRDGVIEAQQQYERLVKAAEATKDDAEKKRLAEQARATKKILDQRLAAMKREGDMMKAAAREQRNAAKNVAQSFESGAEGLRGFMSGGDFAGGLVRGAKGLGGRMQGAGEAKIKAAEGAGSMKQAAQMAKIGSALAKVGAALATVAAVVGAIVVLVKLFADLEAKVKDMNKALIDTAGAADFGMSRVEIMSGKLAERLDELRDQTTAVNRNFMKFRVNFKEQQQILAQFNQAGYTYARMNEDIEKNASHMRSYSDATALAITYSRNLGVATGDIANTMGSFAFETGMGLQDIAEQFSVIQREAMQAGFATKRFYSTIVEVTSGMAFYGVRIDETAKLLKTFDSLLGEAVGTEAFKKIVGQYKDKGAQDRIRELILKDQDFAQEQFAAAFERQIRNLAKTGGKLGLSEDEMRELLQMDEVAMSARLQRLGASPEQIQEFQRTAMVGRAAQGGMGAMTRAMPFAGPGFDIAMASQATQVFGGKRIDEVLRGMSTGETGAAELAALQQVTGKSMEEIEHLGGLFREAEAAMSEMRRIAAIAPEERSEADLAQLEAYKKMGLFLDEQGNIVKGELGDDGNMVAGTGKVVKDALMAVTETTSMGEEDIKEQLTKDQQIATEISRNITGLHDIFEQTTNMILERIYDAVMSVYEWLVRDDTARLADAEAQRAAKRNLDALKSQEDSLRKEIADLTQEQAKAEAAGDQKLVDEIKEKIETRETDLLAVEQAATAIADDMARRQGLTVEERLAQKGGAALGGLDIKLGGATRGKDISSLVDEAVGRRTFGDDDLFFGDIEAIGKDLSSFFGADMGERTMAKFRESGLAAQLGEEELAEAVARASAAGQAARDKIGWFGGSQEDLVAAEEAAFSESLKRDLVPLLTKAATLQEKQLQEEKKSSFFNPFKFFDRANDLVIPASGGKPILTDPADTLMAFKPGGPISQAMGGGRGGGVTVNVYGGDQKKVYETVMRALKAVGHA